MHMKRWVLLNEAKIKSIDDVVKIFLRNRGIKGHRQVEKFLNPSLDELTFKSAKIDTAELKKAYIRIRKAIEDNESIIVYTDYDVDGICGGAIIWETIYRFHKKVMPYIPDRKAEGYGLSKKGIDFVKKEYNTSLIITVDHGISGKEHIDYAKSLGIDTIILDHHLLPRKLPTVSAVIHTTYLSAGAIAWFFANYLINRLSNCKLDNSAIHNLDLAALATIADLVPLTGLNRVIVKYGLTEINRTKRLGLSILIKEAGLKKGEIGVYEVGHMIAPRINAVGRIDHALDALRLICTKDAEKAKSLARRLNVVNRERQMLMAESAVFASKIVRSKKLDKLIVVQHESFNEGIVGLVAGKLVDEFYRPAIVIAKGKEYSKASARSINGFNIVETIRKFSHLLESVGGHPMAAGFTVATKNIEVLEKELKNITEKELSEQKLEKELKIDLETGLFLVTSKLYEIMEKLSPFGIGNPQPVFASRNVEVVGASLVGRDRQHLKLVVRPFSTKIGDSEKNSVFKAIGFAMGDIYYRLSPGTRVDIAYTVELDKWNGEKHLQLKLKDVKLQH